MSNVKKIIISSTMIDLPNHRKAAMNGCIKQKMLPIMMEHMPANSDDAISASLKLVDEADIYLGIYANRYGFIPKNRKFSITELEYKHAINRGIPTLIFIMHKEHTIVMNDVETGESARKIIEFKNKIKSKHIVNYFKSPNELESLVINSLSNL